MLRIGVAASDPRAAPDAELSERVHASAGDPDEVDGATVSGVDERHEGAGNIDLPPLPLKSETA